MQSGRPLDRSDDDAISSTYVGAIQVAADVMDAFFAAKGLRRRTIQKKGHRRDKEGFQDPLSRR